MYRRLLVVGEGDWPLHTEAARRGSSSTGRTVAHGLQLVVRRKRSPELKLNRGGAAGGRSKKRGWAARSAHIF